MNSSECLQRANDRTSTVSKEQLIRVVLAEGHPIVRFGLHELLVREGDFEIVGETSEGSDVVRLVNKTQPDLLVLDLRIPNRDSVAILQTLQKRRKKLNVVCLAAPEDANYVAQAIRAGCSGVVLKDIASELIAKIVRGVHQGKFLDLVTAAPGMDFDRGPFSLSTREREIAILAAQGYKNVEIAGKLSISGQTVKNHLHNIYIKIGFSDRVGLVRYLMHEGLRLRNP